MPEKTIELPEPPKYYKCGNCNNLVIAEDAKHFPLFEVMESLDDEIECCEVPDYWPVQELDSLEIVSNPVDKTVIEDVSDKAKIKNITLYKKYYEKKKV